MASTERTGIELARAALREGVWRAELRAEGAPPQVEVLHLGQPLAGAELTRAGEGRYALSVPIPAELLSDGVHSFVLTDKASGDKLGSFAIIAGEPADDDLRAEIDLLRAELDMLKRAFRRHCIENMCGGLIGSEKNGGKHD